MESNINFLWYQIHNLVGHIKYQNRAIQQKVASPRHIAVMEMLPVTAIQAAIGAIPIARPKIR